MVFASKYLILAVKVRKMIMNVTHGVTLKMSNSAVNLYMSLQSRGKYSSMAAKTFPQMSFSSQKTLPCIWKACSEYRPFTCSFLLADPHQRLFELSTLC